jgi:hypothetical protein
MKYCKSVYLVINDSHSHSRLYRLPDTLEVNAGTQYRPVPGTVLMVKGELPPITNFSGYKQPMWHWYESKTFIIVSIFSTKCIILVIKSVSSKTRFGSELVTTGMDRLGMDSLHAHLWCPVAQRHNVWSTASCHVLWTYCQVYNACTLAWHRMENTLPFSVFP